MKILTAVLMTALLCGRAAAEEQKSSADAWKTRVFSTEELKKYNGKDGAPVYAAVDGIVYDLSKSKYWKTGQHMKMHDAGADLEIDGKLITANGPVPAKKYGAALVEALKQEREEK